MKKDKILFIVEGEVVEPKVLESILSQLDIDKNQIYSYKTNIYTLYQKLMETFEEDEEYDLFAYLVELESKKTKPDNIINLSRDQIAEIYLLFDLDGHHSEDVEGNVRKIKKLVTMFNNETSLGKLYISYPMVEALTMYHRLENSHINFYQFKINDNMSKSKKKFKSICNNNPKSHHLKKQYTHDDIKWIMRYHLLLCSEIYRMIVTRDSYRDIVSVEKTLELQEEYSLENENLIFVYSGIAEFLLDYLKVEELPEINSDEKILKKIFNIWDD